MGITYTPAHGSWLNRAEIEFAVLGRQALNRAFADKAAVSGGRTLANPAKRKTQAAKLAIQNRRRPH